MTCQEFQSELLSVPDPRELPDRLQRHVHACAACAAVAEQTALLESVVANLPVPAADPDRQAAFLQKILAEPPIIVRQQATAAQGRALEWPPAAKMVGSLAASVMLLAGAWWLFREPAPSAGPLATYHRHELLARQVQHTVALAHATTAPKRFSIWTEVAGDLRQEVQQVYRIAARDEMNNLSNLFDSAVQNGLISQAEAIPQTVSLVERNQLLRDAISRLERTETDTESLSLEAPPQSQDALKRIAQTAKKGRQRLQTLLQQGGA